MDWLRTRLNTYDPAFFGSRVNYWGGSAGSESKDPYSEHDWTYACIDAISKAVSAVPLVVMIGDRKAPKLAGGDWQKFFDSPCPRLTRAEFWRASIIYLYTTEGVKWMLLGKTGMRRKDEIPVEAWPVPARCFTPLDVRGDPVIDLSTPIAKWRVQTGGKMRDIEAHQVVSLQFFNPANPIKGFSPLSPAQAAINASYAAQVWNASFFVNNCDPGGWIETPGAANDTTKKQIKESFNEEHRGPAKRGKIMVLSNGAKFSPNPRSQKDMEFIEGQKFSRESILAVFGVPAAVLGLSQGITYSNFQDSMRVFYDNTITPLFSNFEDAIYAQIVRSVTPEQWLKFDTANVPAFNSDFGIRLDNAVKLSALGYDSNAINDRLQLGMKAQPMLDLADIDTTSELADAGVAQAEGAAVADTAMNGAQIASLVEIVALVSSGQLPADAAVGIIKVAFPTIDASEALSIVQPAASFSPTNQDEAQGAIEKMVADEVAPRTWIKRGRPVITNRKEYAAALVRDIIVKEKHLSITIQRYLRTLTAEQRRLLDAWRKKAGLTAKDTLELSQADIEAIIFNEKRWNETLKTIARPSIESVVRDSLKTAADEIASLSIPMKDPRIAALMGRTMATLVQVNATSQRRVRAQILTAQAEGETIGDLQARIGTAINASPARALNIARTETGMAAEGARHIEFQDAEVQKHEWVNSGFGERESHADKPTGVGGEIRKLGERFSNGLLHPLEIGAPADEVCNCRCTAISVFD